MLHYTWGTLVNDLSGKKVWTFEKRDYIAADFEKQVSKTSWKIRSTDLDIQMVKDIDSTSILKTSEKILQAQFYMVLAAFSGQALQVPLLPLPPLFKEGWMLHEGGAYDREIHNTTLAMLKQMNKAILNLPTL